MWWGLLKGDERASIALAQAIVDLRLEGLQRLSQFRDLVGQRQRIQNGRLVLGQEGRRELLDDLDIRLGVFGQLGGQQTVHTLLLRVLVSLVLGLGGRVLLRHTIQHGLFHLDAALAFHGIGNRVRLATDAHLGRRVADDNGRLDGVVAGQKINKGLVGGSGLGREASRVEHVAGSLHGRKHGRVARVIDSFPEKFEFAEGLGDGDHPLMVLRWGWL